MARRILIVLGLLVLQIFFMYEVSGIIWSDKMEELETELGRISFDRRSDSLINISGRLKLIENRLAKGDSPIENYEYEARVQSISSGNRLYNSDGEVSRRRPSPLSVLAKKIMGRTNRAADSEPAYFTILEEAYFLERNRLYGSAVEVYSELLRTHGEELRENLKQTIVLHVAFSQVMQADYSEAERTLGSVVEGSSNLIFTMTADRIMGFISALKDRGTKLALLKEDSLELGRELYFSVRYGEAIETLEKYIRSPENSDREAEARYYLARALEEVGQTGGAISEYQRILVLSRNENIIRESGRRMMMLKSFYDIPEGETEKLAESLKEINDPEFQKIIQPLEKLYVEPDSVHEQKNPEGADELVSEEKTMKELLDYGEVYITTVPTGARISVNRIFFGISPIFVTSLPEGKVLIEAEYENMKGSTEIEISSKSVRRADIILKGKTTPAVIPGKLKINHNLEEPLFLLDEKDLEYKSGSEIDLVPGKYVLVAEGKDQAGQLFFWESVVSIEPGELTEITIP